MIPLIKLFGWQLQIYIVLCVNKFWLFGISMCILKMFRFEHHIMNRLITDILILKHWNGVNYAESTRDTSN